MAADPPLSNAPLPTAAPASAVPLRPAPVVTRRKTARTSHNGRRVDETSPAPLGFSALLREINTAVELLERIDQALEADLDKPPENACDGDDQTGEDRTAVVVENLEPFGAFFLGS